jgi:hypothetical protein
MAKKLDEIQNNMHIMTSIEQCLGVNALAVEDLVEDSRQTMRESTSPFINLDESENLILTKQQWMTLSKKSYKVQE